MLKKNSIKVLILSTLFFSGLNACATEFGPSDFSSIKTLDLDKSFQNKSEFVIDLNRTTDNSKAIDLNQNDASYQLVNATDRFVQCNIKASWEDFKTLINNAEPNDFTYISLANKMADLGFFDLATLAESKIQDKNLSYVSMDAMKRFYFPRRKIKFDDEMFLAEAFSNISFNNQSSEAANELLSKENLLINYDYANYLMALGEYKSNAFSKAAKYINIAILQNPTNLNYQKLKAEILAENNEPDEALKTVENLKRQNLYSYEYERKIKSLEQFILYKTKKTQWEKDYHLGYYYYIENDPSKAIRTLQDALSSGRRANASLIYGLMGEVYLSMDEFEKAADTARKAHKSNCHDIKALITLGDLEYRNGNYKQALEYYKKSASLDKKSYIPLVKEAQTYQKLSNTKKASEIYAKVLKTHSDSWEAYYNVALLDDTKKTIYIKKALAVNPMFKDGWIELAKDEINNGNLDIAQKYLTNSFEIDENDYRYYYYQGLINCSYGNYSQAKYNFKKCLKLNKKFKDAQTELENILNNDKEFIKQDNL